VITNLRIGLIFPEVSSSEYESYFNLATKHIISNIQFPESTCIPLEKSQLFSALENDEVDVVVTNLEHAPYLVPQNCRYIGLLENKHNNPFLLVPENQYAASEDLKMLPGTVVGVPDEISGYQLNYLNVDINFKVTDNTTLHNPDLWSDNGIQAALYLSPANNQTKEPLPFMTVPLHPGEFLRTSGTGKIVFAVHRESLAVSRFIFDTFHTPGLPAISNTERKIALHFNGRDHLIIKTYCRKDERNNFHLKAGIIDLRQKKYFQHTMSQSTHFKLAEKMTDVLESLCNLS
jgi:hypothetical protein